MENSLKIVRRRQSARSRHFRGVLTQVIYERDGLELRRTEMDAGSACESVEFGDLSAVHFVTDGTPLFRASDQSADLMPGDSIIFDQEERYTILNGGPPRSVILSVLFKARAPVCTIDCG
jgi:hypothetical protein